MTEPAEVDYGQRAGVQPRPADWVDFPDLAAHTRTVHAEFAATAPITFWADVSEYQPPIDGTYPYPKFGFRADTGSRLDVNARANWSYCVAHPDHIRVAVAYVVFKPGQSAAIMSRLRGAFGSICPPNMVPEIDMESGSGFAGPGNHSAEANDLMGQLAAWTGQQPQTQGYANGNDWAGNWPTPPAWMKRRLAAYSTSPTPAGYYARQYYGALPYGSPAGWPRSCPPFGSYVDMNATERTIDQILTDYGIGGPVALDDSDKAWFTNLMQMQYQALTGTENSVFSGGTNIQDAVNAIKNQLSYLALYIGGTDNSVYNGGTSAEDVRLQMNSLDQATQQQLAAILAAIEALDTPTPGPSGPVTGGVTGTLTFTPQET